MQINLENVSKKYKKNEVLRNINLGINSGELVALIGPSGSGKSTLLKIIAGMENPSSGIIYIDNKNVDNMSLQDRNIGFVFQHYALFKHMNIFENIAFAYRVKPSNIRPSDNEIKRKVEELAELVKISDLLDRQTHELSGGQRQRVALARALAVEPKILLLDEPFAALDYKLKLELRKWLRKLKKESNITIILVTHDQEEALDIADRVYIVNEGQIIQHGSPEEIYLNPANAFVYNFLGHYNIFTGVKDKENGISLVSSELSNMRNDKKWYAKNKIVSNFMKLLSTKTKESANINELESSEVFDIFVRPHDIDISTKEVQGGSIQAKIVHLNMAAPFVKIELESPEYSIIHVEISHEKFKSLNLRIGDIVFLKPISYTIYVE